jgi:hypothetical protein
MTMMISVLLIATMSIVATDDADVINAHCYCARSKMKRRTSSLDSHACLFGMHTVTLYKLECQHSL